MSLVVNWWIQLQPGRLMGRKDGWRKKKKKGKSTVRLHCNQSGPVFPLYLRFFFSLSPIQSGKTWKSSFSCRYKFLSKSFIIISDSSFLFPKSFVFLFDNFDGRFLSAASLSHAFMAHRYQMHRQMFDVTKIYITLFRFFVYSADKSFLFFARCFFGGRMPCPKQREWPSARVTMRTSFCLTKDPSSSGRNENHPMCIYFQGSLVFVSTFPMNRRAGRLEGATKQMIFFVLLEDLWPMPS